MLLFLLLINAAAVYWVPVGSTEYTDVVQTSYGPIKGEELSFDGTKYKAFRNIPYAAPPVGDLMFRAPETPEKWTDIRDATSNNPFCRHPREVPQGVASSSEYCLTLNVFTQSVGENSLKPVLVRVLGDGFLLEPNDVAPGHLIQEDIVMVTVRFRLGSLGFLPTNLSGVSGNWGLKDQVAALKWVQENIELFGGDPKKVTLFGSGSSAACAHLHLFSTHSKGLFHKVILSSGSAINTWTLTPSRASESYSKHLAASFGASESQIQDPTQRVQFLREALANETVKGRRWIKSRQRWAVPLIDNAAFTPVLEDAGAEGAFLTEYPRVLLREGRFTKVPMMIGVTNLEGIPNLLYRGGNLSVKLMMKTEENVCEILPPRLRYEVTRKDDCTKVAQEISTVYFDGKPFGSSELNYVNLRSDLLIVLDVHLAQRMHAKLSDADTPVYSYVFTFDGQLSGKKDLINFTLPGAANKDDLRYIFRKINSSLLESPSESPDVITQNRMARFFANFVKYSDPTPSTSDIIPVKWEPANKEEPKTMVIGNELKLENEFLKTRMDLWDRLYKEYTGSPLFS